jgi:hypothetical protein
LKIGAEIDGSDCLVLTSAGAHWEHLYWAFPSEVTLNEVTWKPAEENGLKNDDATRFLPAGVDLSSARIIGRQGRDLATLWATKDEVKIYFADNPNGKDTYELTIGFGE